MACEAFFVTTESATLLKCRDCAEKAFQCASFHLGGYHATAKTILSQADFFRKQTQSWYVQSRGRQIPLGRDKEAAWKKYHELMAEHHLGPVADESVAGVLNRYLVWARANRARSTFKRF